MKVDIAIPDLPKLVENAASFGEPAALNSRFNKGIVALAAQATAAFPVESSPEVPAQRRTHGGGVCGRRLMGVIPELSEDPPVWFGRRQASDAASSGRRG